eukprot:GHVS01002466.1.p2 GENE.GHVS01002466.1~~GHVS01002466.1.p2  ORF type:complete len:176 (-),score=15.58 GHVS01002466.1:453-980(-)
MYIYMCMWSTCCIVQTWCEQVYHDESFLYPQMVLAIIPTCRHSYVWYRLCVEALSGLFESPAKLNEHWHAANWKLTKLSGDWDKKNPHFIANAILQDEEMPLFMVEHWVNRMAPTKPADPICKYPTDDVHDGNISEGTQDSVDTEDSTEDEDSTETEGSPRKRRRVDWTKPQGTQ